MAAGLGDGQEAPLWFRLDLAPYDDLRAGATLVQNVAYQAECPRRSRAGSGGGEEALRRRGRGGLYDSVRQSGRGPAGAVPARRMPRGTCRRRGHCWPRRPCGVSRGPTTSSAYALPPPVRAEAGPSPGVRRVGGLYDSVRQSGRVSCGALFLSAGRRVSRPATALRPLRTGPRRRGPATYAPISPRRQSCLHGRPTGHRAMTIRFRAHAGAAPLKHNESELPVACRPSSAPMRARARTEGSPALGRARRGPFLLGPAPPIGGRGRAGCGLSLSRTAGPRTSTRRTGRSTAGGTRSGPCRSRPRSGS